MKIRTHIAKYLALLAIALGLAPELKAAITDNLVVHLTFDNDYNDSSGNGINGAATGTPTFEAGTLGQAVHITSTGDDVTNNYVTLGYPAGLELGTSDFSVSFWVKVFSQNDDKPFIANKDWGSGGNQGFVIASEGDGLKWNFKDDQSARRDSPHVAPQVLDKNWHHVAVTFQRNSVGTIYVDGVSVNTTSVAPDSGKAVGSVDTDTLGLSMNLGQDGIGTYTDGTGAAAIDMLMDDLGIWRRVLSGAEVNAIYSFGLNGTNLANVPIIDPFVTSTIPAPLATDVLPSAPISAVITDGGINKLATNSIQFLLNGTAKTPSITKSGTDTTVQYTPPSMLPAGSANTVTLIFANNATPATTFTNTWAFTVANYHVIPSTAGTAPGSANTPGFRARSVQARMDANLPNSIARQEAQLAGTLIDPTTGQPYVNHAFPGPNSDGSYDIDLVNFNLGGGDAGSVTGDLDFTTVGVPGDESSGFNFAVEILAFLDLKAGYHRFGVNSDDGFVLRAGPDARDATSQVLGFYDGGRGPGDTFADFVVQTDGVYSFRLGYEQGNGGAALEFFSVDLTTGTRTLINDPSDPNAVKAYRVRPGSGATPFVSVLVPSSPVNIGPDVVISATIQNSATAVVTNSIKLYFDGTQVQPSIQPSSGTNTLVQYDPPGLLASLSTHDLQLVFADNGTPVTTKTNEFQFSVSSYVNKILPTPIYFENFESAVEGGLPAGWTSTNNTDSLEPGSPPDIGDPKSDAYLGWLVITRDQVYINGTNDFHVWEADDPDGRVSTIAPGQVVNGVVLAPTNLMENKFVYIESDERGGNQVAMLFSPNYDLTGKSNIWVSFHSSYEQNQDNIGALEYSVDGGTNWLPVLYMLDGPDIVHFPDGSVDAVTTLNQINTDTAYGTSYGTYIAAPISQALAPYISARVNDDNVESHRVELFPLPQADNKSKVTFRFAYAGTASWYWGVDDFGLYSIPPVSSSPTLSISSAAGSVTISWPSAVTGFTLESTDSLTAPSWSPVSGVANNSVTITVGAGNKFYRLHQ